jgi:ubiquinone/menaquinone biosynthesis C-methylase UbiE
MRILNIGCGADTYGTDFVDIYPLRPDVKKCNIDKQKLPYPDNVFDEVYSKNIFEHLQNPGFALKDMVRVLKKGGRLITITDNAGFLLFHIPIRKNNFLEHNANDPRFGNDDRHYMLFTKLHLENFYKKAGLKIQELNYDWFPSSKFAKIKRFLRFAEKIKFLSRLLFPHIAIVGIK